MENPLQCSCLENPRDGGAWWAAVYGVTQSQTRLKRLSSGSSSMPTWCHILDHRLTKPGLWVRSRQSCFALLFMVHICLQRFSFFNLFFIYFCCCCCLSILFYLLFFLSFFFLICSEFCHTLKWNVLESIAHLQCCIIFSSIAKWISHTYTYIHSPLDPSHLFL